MGAPEAVPEACEGAAAWRTNAYVIIRSVKKNASEPHLPRLQLLFAQQC